MIVHYHLHCSADVRERLLACLALSAVSSLTANSPIDCKLNDNVLGSEKGAQEYSKKSLTENTVRRKGVPVFQMDEGSVCCHGSAPSVGKLKRVQDVGEQQMCFLTSCSRHFMNVYPFIFFYIYIGISICSIS